MDGAAILLGCAPLAIPPSYHLRLLDLREQMARARGSVDEEDLHDWDIELRQTYFAIKEDACHPRLPALRNTDGDPLVPTTLRFDLRCAPGEAFARLKSLALDAGDEELLANAERDAAGQLRAVRFTWLERGNQLHESWKNTVLGTVAIDGPRLTIEVNSARRAQRLRDQVEERLGELAVFRAAVTESIEEQLARPPSPDEERRNARARRASASRRCPRCRRPCGRSWPAIGRPGSTRSCRRSASRRRARPRRRPPGASGWRPSSPTSPGTRATPRSRSSSPTWRRCARGWGCDRRTERRPRT